MAGVQLREAVTFRLVQGIFQDGTDEEFLYGVEAVQGEDFLFLFNDLTWNRRLMEQAILLWNKAEISFWHARDIVEDFVTDLYLPEEGR